MLFKMYNNYHTEIGDAVYVDKYGSIYKRKSKNRTLIGKVLGVGIDYIKVVIEPVCVKTRKEREQK